MESFVDVIIRWNSLCYVCYTARLKVTKLNIKTVMVLCMMKDLITRRKGEDESECIYFESFGQISYGQI